MLLLYILYQPLYCDPATYRAKIQMVKDETNYTALTFKIVSLRRGVRSYAQCGCNVLAKF